MAWLLKIIHRLVANFTQGRLPFLGFCLYADRQRKQSLRTQTAHNKVWSRSNVMCNRVVMAIWTTASEAPSNIPVTSPKLSKYVKCTPGQKDV